MAAADELIAGVVEQRRVWEAALAEQGLTVPTHPLLERTLPGVWEASDYVAKSCIRYPDILPQLLASGRLEAACASGEPERLLAAELEGVTDDRSLAAVLRRFRHRELVRIIWRDIAALAGLEETLEDLSALADACVGHSLRLLHGWLTAELGTPRDAAGAEQYLVVLGMGKLGARELNLSSDIDLIFAYTGVGQTDGRRPLTNEQFFVRLAQRLIQALDTNRADGFVFRVDARLRPFGDVGPLAMSFGAMEDYYQSQAREWERYALIKARVVAGDPAAGERLMAMLRPFVYRRYLDFGAIESLRDMKRMIDKELKRKGLADNIKLGPGGIREIEFIGQTFQLIRGGRDPELQLSAIQPVLQRLGEKDLLPAQTAQGLGAAYRYLRRVENRLQAWQDRQTHALPEDAVGRLRLARTMGCTDWEGFCGVLEEHRRRVQAEFDRVFAAPHAEEEPRDRPFATLWSGSADDGHYLEQLAQAGFKDAGTVLRRLRTLRDAALRKGLGRRGNDRMARLIPLVLHLAAGTHDPDLVLERVLRVLESVLSRTAYLAMLIEHPIILSQLAQLAGMSPWFTDRIVHHPLLLDELLDPRRLYAPLRRADLEAELDSLLAPLADDDLEQQMERLRQFAQGNILRVAAADLTDVIPLMIVSDYLTEIAEVAVSRVLALASDHLQARHGRPGGIAGEGSGLLVLGYGKLGGLELGYGSDLDLVFLHGSDRVNAETRGNRPIANDQFYLRLGQRMIHIITTRTPSGQLYAVDMRLRPDGDKGMLVRSLKSFASYQTREAWTWEHQALVRARPVAGDRVLAERFGQVRREVLCREREPKQLRLDVRAMRERMRKNLDRTRNGWFDLKQGHGGIADIEFMVQYLVLRWAARYPALADWTDNIRLLETLARCDLLPGTAAADLTGAYKALRAAYHRSALQEQPTRIPDNRLVGPREQVRAWWRELMED
ncbi:bifunctional [glutamate--ammonia ligase]-adenylyl-L-tyrosine phosphorylase/[glutamate--ammonia-ligase] adenylyltransferase [Candidatus Thiosymbion oneisti]|uniref:bifunctional [glutamate--ammonia ligase]-adenylyl-L-tyrosine phosphorylase/[glutamate--ammonia-ligase] adenylyltransferase n=1 Tax=Candidatus Thiosymbion oneisti TaxID=589554 RepID=UPI000AFE4E8E|nr:bifunctional [glutamate--ammonia ligase]-adenylyl-L-tyrosine phosphorylase/[glutamate--ammonia-ligase] adenylyltransferase [Candidatus Thiosymbion oneisti]